MGTLVDPSNLQYDDEDASMNKLDVLLHRKLNLSKHTDATVKACTRSLVRNISPPDEFDTGQDLIDWHNTKIADMLSALQAANLDKNAGDTSKELKQRKLLERRVYHDFSLAIIPLMLTNTKTETTFSHHKRVLMTSCR